MPNFAPEVMDASATTEILALGGINPSWATPGADMIETFPRSMGAQAGTPLAGFTRCVAVRATRDVVVDSIGCISGNPVDGTPWIQMGAYSLDTDTGAMQLLGKTKNLRTAFSPAIIERRFFLYNEFQVVSNRWYVAAFSWFQNLDVQPVPDRFQFFQTDGRMMGAPYGSPLGWMYRYRNDWPAVPSNTGEFMPETLNWMSMLPPDASNGYARGAPYMYFTTGGDLSP